MSKGVRAWRVLLGFGFQADRRQWSVLFSAVVLGQVARLAVTYGMKLLTDAVVQHRLEAALSAAVLIALTGAVGRLCGRSYVALVIQIEEKAGHLLDRRLARLIAGIPGLEHYERPDYANEVELLRGQRRLLAQCTNATVLNLQIYLQLLGSMLLLVRLQPLLLVVPIFGLGSFWTGRQATALQEAAQEANAERARLRNHLKRLPTSPSAAKELRVFGLGDEILERYHAVGVEMERVTSRAAWLGAAYTIGGGLCFVAGYASAILVVLLRALGGAATPGDVVLVIRLVAGMNSTISQAVEMGHYLGRAIRAAGRYLWLLDYAAKASPEPSDPLPVPVELQDGITIEHLSFRYPGTDTPVLSDVSLHLPAGAMVALVGENGAGKSTLIKLLCRFYEPVNGGIRADGVDLRRFDTTTWRSRLSAGFQDFSRFEFLVQETVGVGDLPRAHDVPAVQDAVVRGGADDVVAALPRGLATQLGTAWDGGIDLSGGQWQKMALARASMRPTPLILILDEPTAAIDAVTEHALFERFKESARSREHRPALTLVVSHRFSTVRMADLIVVFDKGRVLEAGSHAELMERQGLYAELYELQARAYQ